MHALLEQINDPQDLRKLDPEQLEELAAQLRRFIIETIAVKKGHLGASLGVVELTIALHYVFNTPADQLIWDVGHQAYGHKILTGRREQFHTNRQKDGLSGFPKRSESEYDTFGTGHSSTAISAALGMAMAAELNKDTRCHIAVVGDASIASGMAFEALNHAGVTKTNLLVILNDNAIGIDPSVGALKDYLTKVTLHHAPETDNIFEALNFQYTGPVDGHDLPGLIKTLKELKQQQGPRLLHLITTKGKGLKQAEEQQVTYHAPGPFDAATGELLPSDSTDVPDKFQDVFGHTLVELGAMNPDIIGITPAMPTGSSLKYFMEAYPQRGFDVGIAEQHAVTLAAGMATAGKTVYCNIYSTFLQRAYDQLIHDVCLQNLPLVFCLDRAGIVGEDGATHHGIFDLAYLRCIPNLSLFAPATLSDLRNMLYTAQLGLEGPLAIRYPRGRGQQLDWQKEFERIPWGKAKQLRTGKDIAVLSIGAIATEVSVALAQLEEESNLQAAHFDMRFVVPLDTTILNRILQDYHTVITIEDGVIQGGFGSAILEFAADGNYTNTIRRLGIDGNFPQHGTVAELRQEAGMDADSIANLIKKLA